MTPGHFEIIKLLGIDPTLIEKVLVDRIDNVTDSATIGSMMKVFNVNTIENNEVSKETLCKVMLEMMETFVILAHLYHKFMYKKIKDQTFYFFLVLFGHAIVERAVPTALYNNEAARDLYKS